MSRQKLPAEPPEDVPKWFMTYSDVITLLMTFFILLLTFATNEPERFEKMKVSMFGGSGSAGIAGANAEGVDKDSLVMRIRNKSARQAERGSEMPPVDKDASENALDKGLSGLDSQRPQIDVNSINLTLPIGQLASSDGQVFEYGEKTIGMFAKLSMQRAMDIKFETNNKANLPRIMALVDYMVKSKFISADRIEVQYDSKINLATSHIHTVLQFVDGVIDAEGETSAK